MVQVSSDWREWGHPIHGHKSNLHEKGKQWPSTLFWFFYHWPPVTISLNSSKMEAALTCWYNASTAGMSMSELHQGIQVKRKTTWTKTGWKGIADKAFSSVMKNYFYNNIPGFFVNVSTWRWTWVVLTLKNGPLTTSHPWWIGDYKTQIKFASYKKSFQN